MGIEQYEIVATLDSHTSDICHLPPKAYGLLFLSFSDLGLQCPSLSQSLSKMNTSKVNAGRLIMTEEAYFSSAAQKDCFQDLGVEQYEIVATLDSHTSDICQNLDGQVFPMKDFEPGVTAPPFHVYCM